MNSGDVMRDFRLLHYLPGAFYIVRFENSQWSLLNVTAQTEALFGYNRDELLSDSRGMFQKLIHPDDLGRIIQGKQNSIQTDKLFDLEFRIITKSSEVRYVRDRFIVYKQGGNWLMEGCISETTNTNIRDRLLQQLRSYREAVDVNMISSITDASGQIVYANENFCKISKYSMWELVGQNHRIVNSGYHPRSFFEQMWNTIRSGRVWKGELLNKAKDGTSYWVDTVIIPILNEHKEIVNYLSLRMLINEKKEGERNRRQYIYLLEQIAFIVAHDVRGPLCRIIGLASLLSRGGHPDVDNRQMITYLEEQAAELNRITSQLSHFVHSNEIEIRLRDIDDYTQYNIYSG